MEVAIVALCAIPAVFLKEPACNLLRLCGVNV